MQIITEIHEIKKILDEERKSGVSVGLVPTMGYFHHGHISLIKKARKDNELVAVSIFINPTQFSKGEDLENYPKNFEKDFEIAKQLGVDYIFKPNAKDMYIDTFQTMVEVEELSKPLCGKFRPSHFKGVATVVLKLFNIISPDKAYFGLKDYQQYRVIEKMVFDLNLNIEIVALPIVRDDDGLAASSRNSYLTYDERDQAGVLYQALMEVKKLFEKGIKNSSDLTMAAREAIKKRPLVKLEYLEIVDKKSLKPVEQVIRDKTLIAVAAKVGKARLIDNIEI